MRKRAFSRPGQGPCPHPLPPPGSKLLPISSLSLCETAVVCAKGYFPRERRLEVTSLSSYGEERVLMQCGVGLTGGRSCVL